MEATFAHPDEIILLLDTELSRLSKYDGYADPNYIRVSNVLKDWYSAILTTDTTQKLSTNPQISQGTGH